MVKPRENRVPIMMSDEELKVVDDWRFNNRVGTRSDAIRRLVQIGLLTGAEIEKLSDTTLELSSAMHRLDEETFDLWTKVISPVWKGETLNRKGVADILRNLVLEISEVDGGVDDVASILVGLVQGVVGLSRAGSLAEGQDVASNAIKETNENLAKMRALRAESEQNRKALSEIDFSDSWKTGGKE